MKKAILLVILFIAISGNHLFAQNSCTSLRYQDTIFHTVSIDTGIYFGSAIPFGSSTAQNLYLDIYQPANDTLKVRPLIVYQFGGGFVIGWREEPDIPQFCTYFAQLGYIVVTIDYRIGLNPLDTASTVRAFYRGVQDERSAIRFLCQNAQQYGIDTSRIILTGTSAGCFCAFGNVYMNDSLRPAATYGSTLEPTDMGCMDCSGNNDYGKRIPRMLSIFNMWGAMLDTNYITTAKGVPTISFQGDQDILVPYTYGYPFQLPVFPPVYGAVPIHERQDNQGIPNEFHPLVGYGHEPELLAPWLNDTMYNYGRKFLWPLLKPQTSAITGDSILCSGGMANYSVVNTLGSKYCWSLSGNGTIVQNNNNSIAVIWADTGLVSISVTELNNIGAEGDLESFQTRVVAHSHPTFTDSTNQLAVSFTNTSLNSTSNYWTFGDGDISIVTSPNEVYPAPGTYTIQLFTNNGYCTDSVKHIVTLDTCPVAHFTYYMEGLNVYFYADTTNTLNYYWNFGDGDSVNVNALNLLHQYLQNGTYFIKLEVRNDLGCTAEDTATLVISGVGIPAVSASKPLIICNPINDCLIQTTGGQSWLVEVFDILGRKLSEQKFTGVINIETSNLPSGIYLLKLSGGGQTIVKKFVRE